MTRDLVDGRPAFFSTLPAQRRDHKLAWAAVLLSALAFAAAAPFAKTPLFPVPAFIPLYQSALVVCDVVTAVLLFGQFGILRSRGLLFLACAYLFTALMAFVHLLTFPGAFAPAGLLGAGPQSTAWLYMFWHGGFPALVIAYALSTTRGEQDEARPVRRARLAIPCAVAAVVAAACGFAALATAGQALLPPIMEGNHYRPAMLVTVTSVWGLSLLALAALSRRKPYTVLDLWLMVVMCAWLFDIALAAVLNAGRFDLGFYAGRAYGLLAASFVLVVMLIENSLLYARLVEAHRREGEKAAELLAANQELETFSRSISHDLRSPLRAMTELAKRLEQSHGEALGTDGRRLLGMLGQCCHRMAEMVDGLLEFSRLGRQTLKVQKVQLDALVKQILEELRPDYDRRRIEFVVDELGDADVDPVLLKQALSNLLGNAIKYTSKKADAVVEVRCRPEEEGPGKVYWVKDNGAGFNMEYATGRLFGVFQRFHRNDEFEGTGVGLAIVQQVINRHGGRLWADAHPGQGAAFYFTLPPHADGAAAYSVAS